MLGGEGCCDLYGAGGVAKMVKTVKNMGKGKEGVMGQKTGTWQEW